MIQGHIPALVYLWKATLKQDEKINLHGREGDKEPTGQCALWWLGLLSHWGNYLFTNGLLLGKIKEIVPALRDFIVSPSVTVYPRSLVWRRRGSNTYWSLTCAGMMLNPIYLSLWLNPTVTLWVTSHLWQRGWQGVYFHVVLGHSWDLDPVAKPGLLLSVLQWTDSTNRLGDLVTGIVGAWGQIEWSLGSVRLSGAWYQENTQHGGWATFSLGTSHAHQKGWH